MSDWVAFVVFKDGVKLYAGMDDGGVGVKLRRSRGSASRFDSEEAAQLRAELWATDRNVAEVGVEEVVNPRTTGTF